MSNVGFTCKGGRQSRQGARVAHASRVTGDLARCRRLLEMLYRSARISDIRMRNSGKSSLAVTQTMATSTPK